VIAQWVWNLRLELGQQLQPAPVRITEFAPAVSETPEQPSLTLGYGKPAVAPAFKGGRFSGQDFTLQSDGTLRCPAKQTLSVRERRKEADGSLRMVYAARIRSGRPCQLREQCPWNGAATAKPRQVSMLLHPHQVGSAPVRLRAMGAGERTDVPDSWTRDDQSVRRPSRFCHLARFSDGLTSS
jgi:hypothetical protein